ncbi:ABC transporter ATP-binding protein [Oceanicella sp. SM1341]|uniref:ABC transporter ATP-binding protein n=1 Tax=Oceanicella sp. SM1341 TaxID=1548889 RepID=UPI000E534C24|nr:ABC transporter ATP-binding protein [Oceanicella sp. SM1341]
MSGTALQVEGLAKRYGGLRAVNGASFEIPEGSITGLIGPNGAGKTTTFNMIAGAEAPSAGRILFRGEDITGRPTHELFHLGIVRTFQLPQEFARLTALENLMAAAPDQPGESILLNWLAPARVRAREAEVLARAEEALAFLGLSHVRDIPAGNLSGGQRKLLELGRTMMTDAQLVLLDEPGAGVNPTLMLRIADMIRRLNAERGYTFCIIEHDMDLIAALCDPVIVLAEGRVLTKGAMAEIREDARVIEAYFGGGAE